MMSVAPLEQWLADAFEEAKPYDEMMRSFAQISSPQAAGGYYQLVGATPKTMWVISRG